MKILGYWQVILVILVFAMLAGGFLFLQDGGIIKIQSQTRAEDLEIAAVPEMDFFGGHIVLPMDKYVTFAGSYNDMGPNRSAIDAFVLQDNNTVKWNHFFLNKKLDILPGTYASVSGEVIKNDVYGYAQLIRVDRWSKTDVEINPEMPDKCKKSIELKSKELSERPLSDIARWDKESLKGYIIEKNYFSNVKPSQPIIDFENQKAIVPFAGARIPPLEGLLEREAYVYCVYDMKNQGIEKLILTIHGGVSE